MKTNEQAETSQNNGSGNKFHESTTSMFDDDDNQSEERQSPNLSMDEVRALLEEFEEILHSE